MNECGGEQQVTKQFYFDRRHLVMAGLAVTLAGCKVIPDGGAPRPAPAPTPTPTATAEPSATVLPTDQARHRIALLVPLSGENAEVGQSIANATTMALLDTNANNLRITTYDTATGPEAAASRAIADGNKLILGPLMGTNVASISATARQADVPIVSFSNDTSIAADNVYVMGHVPDQSIVRSVRYARDNGKSRFAALIPNGEYGQRAEQSMRSAVDSAGGQIVAIERYRRSNAAATSAAQRLQARGGFDAVLIADSPSLAPRGAGPLGGSQILGTELWSGESTIARSTALNGAWFSAVSDDRYRQFRESYSQRFGSPPYRIATLGYDAVLTVLKIANDWTPGSDFPTSKVRDRDGFIGIDGAFRFNNDRVAERAMEVREVRNGSVTIISTAPRSFD